MGKDSFYLAVFLIPNENSRRLLFYLLCFKNNFRKRKTKALNINTRTTY